jgi:hypothetical protein
MLINLNAQHKGSLSFFMQNKFCVFVIKVSVCVCVQPIERG